MAICASLLKNRGLVFELDPTKKVKSLHIRKKIYSYAFAFVLASCTITKAETYRIRFTAKVQGNRLVEVIPHPGDLKGLKLVPGDRLIYKDAQKKDIVIETWSRTFSWQTKRKAGRKKTIVENKSREASIEHTLRWGDSLAPKITIGDVEIKIGTTVPKGKVIHQHFNGTEPFSSTRGFAIAEVKVNRPGSVPANASASTPVIKCRFTTGQIIPGLELTLEIKRSSLN